MRTVCGSKEACEMFETRGHKTKATRSAQFLPQDLAEAVGLQVVLARHGANGVCSTLLNQLGGRAAAWRTSGKLELWLSGPDSGIIGIVPAAGHEFSTLTLATSFG
jgi:hypothetical protein